MGEVGLNNSQYVWKVSSLSGSCIALPDKPCSQLDLTGETMARGKLHLLGANGNDVFLQICLCRSQRPLPAAKFAPRGCPFQSQRLQAGGAGGIHLSVPNSHELQAVQAAVIPPWAGFP